MQNKTYGLDYFKGLSKPFELISNNTATGMTIIEGQHLLDYSADLVIDAPHPSNLGDQVLVHVFGVCHEFADDLYAAYRTVLEDRSKLLESVDVLRRHQDMAYEEPETISYVARSSEALLSNDEEFFEHYDGIGIHGVRNVSIAFSMALGHVMNNGKSYKLTTYEVYHTTVGSYIDTFDGFDEYDSINMVPAATPRILKNNRELGSGGVQVESHNDNVLIIPIAVESVDA